MTHWGRQLNRVRSTRSPCNSSWQPANICTGLAFFRFHPSYLSFMGSVYGVWLFYLDYIAHLALRAGM